MSSKLKETKYIIEAIIKAIHEGIEAIIQAIRKEKEMSAEEDAKRIAREIINLKKEEDNQIADRRLRNTKLLLRNYRMFKAHAVNAVYSAQEVDEDAYDIIDLMSDRYSDSEMFVESIKQSVARTVTIVAHIDTMLKLYKVYCESAGNPEDVRRWNVICDIYINEPPRTIKQLANDYACTERTIYRDIDDACEKIAALIFGIDGIRKG